METLEKNKVKTMMMQFRDIALDVTWTKVAARYFPEKSTSWFYNKINGRDGNGGESDFTYTEKLQLRNGLYDFAERIRKAADSIDV